MLLPSGTRVIDLSHPITAVMPVWPGDPAPSLTPAASYEEDGYFIQQLTLGEHTGTHWATPRTFLPGGRSADQFEAGELVRPAVLIDLAGSPVDRLVTVPELTAWESEHGRIVPGCVVVLGFGWHQHWAEPAAFFGLDGAGAQHWPGLTPDAARFLMQDRGAAGVGTDTAGIDGGNSEDLAAGRLVAEADGLLLECLTGLEQLPATGWTIVIGGLAVTDGSGSPARVLALL